MEVEVNNREQWQEKLCRKNRETDEDEEEREQATCRLHID